MAQSCWIKPALKPILSLESGYLSQYISLLKLVCVELKVTCSPKHPNQTSNPASPALTWYFFIAKARVETSPPL